MNMSRARVALASLIVLGFFTMLGIVLFVPIEPSEIQVEDMLFGALVTAFAGVVAYFFTGDR